MESVPNPLNGQALSLPPVLPPHCSAQKQREGGESNKSQMAPYGLLTWSKERLLTTEVLHTPQS